MSIRTVISGIVAVTAIISFFFVALVCILLKYALIVLVGLAALRYLGLY